MCEPTIESIEQDFPGWHVWQGVNDRWYARLPRTSPPWVAGAEESCFTVRRLVTERDCLGWPVGRRFHADRLIGATTEADDRQACSDHPVMDRLLGWARYGSFARCTASAARVDPPEIARRTGHTSVSFTYERYGHLFPEVDHAAAAKLDAIRSVGLQMVDDATTASAPPPLSVECPASVHDPGPALRLGCRPWTHRRESDRASPASLSDENGDAFPHASGT
jgi:hypothetical protein